MVLKGPSDIILPIAPKENIEKTCHRFFAPIVFPEPDHLQPGKFSVMPRMGNFPCIRAKCMLWNAEKAECFDVTAARGQGLAGEYAYAKMNNVAIDPHA